ncbi:MAG: hypothetical protein DMF07_13145 [Verrucomicrobia bacterium]|nr:MAG: hypothetical protein DMF07_13145 [Verrucomicrobiota bacterium]
MPAATPAAEHDSSIRGKQRNLGIRKDQRAHLRAIRVFFAIALAHIFPTTFDRIFRHENSGC